MTDRVVQAPLLTTGGQALVCSRFVIQVTAAFSRVVPPLSS